MKNEKKLTVSNLINWFCELTHDRLSHAWIDEDLGARWLLVYVLTLLFQVPKSCS